MSVLLYLGNSKRCSKCGKYKDMATEYHRSQSETRGIVSRCKECRNSARRKYRNRVDRFWKFYHARTVQINGCLEWMGNCFSDGDPRCTWGDKRNALVSRVVYQLTVGELPENAVVLHACNNKRCVRQSHLVLGTKVDAEVKRANRTPVGDKHWMRLHPERRPRGEQNGRARLTELDVRAIRKEYARGGVSQREIARSIGVSRGTIRSLINGETWKHVQ